MNTGYQRTSVRDNNQIEMTVKMQHENKMRTFFFFLKQKKHTHDKQNLEQVIWYKSCEQSNCEYSHKQFTILKFMRCMPG